MERAFFNVAKLLKNSHRFFLLTAYLEPKFKFIVDNHIVVLVKAIGYASEFNLEI